MNTSAKTPLAAPPQSVEAERASDFFLIPSQPTTPKTGVEAYVTGGGGIALDQSELHPDEAEKLIDILPKLIAEARRQSAQPRSEGEAE